MCLDDIKGKNFLIMGLGLHGGGMAVARFLLKHGGNLVITDLKNESELVSSIKFLEQFRNRIRYVLGYHDEDDFKNADVVIKNPAVSADNKYLKLAKRIETDISLFLIFNRNPVIAVTGTKGKSTLTYLLHRILVSKYPNSKLGGNIGISPLSFLDDLDGISPIVLELSSWQLHDLKNLYPIISIITNIYHDHQNYYSDFNSYIEDKSKIFIAQDSGILIFQDQAYYDYFYRFKSQSKVVLFSETMPLNFENDIFYFRDGKIYLNKEMISTLSESRIVLLISKMIAVFVASYLSLDLDVVSKIVAGFNGIEHRLEFVIECEGVKYYNDTASTIPDSTVLSIRSLKADGNFINLIVGGTDKELDFSVFGEILSMVKTWILLRGSATLKIIKFLDDNNIKYFIFSSLEECVCYAKKISIQNDIVLFSPASASFELFNNEFDRGHQFKNLLSIMT
ncbi:UDP-N-acetylmuramoyl-L-alanine--D-glutamate ligase [Borrelia miyamotoi]|uniref:UDP-N-acetylmuramoylalanine--D-glutamate ligase n=1 Tax=Borrelia miyamotoi TaxID=47466 RepID=A0AAQ2WVJ6_9SPIR|nr:UDP-N-acetylmuramoyl-L-alanine--D-glutamate ligase [Borrelia miyamotoi]AJA58715.1 UDP-N-acetylmuramoylalanine--D-glutamate ligase [Borrelia miyamotoi]AOW95793.1 UDP-N-acetylmuramoylalanine--D-glutamate ligase [Borrelia miyamotoi]QTL83681.1 UDP-N-acetylmuramoyl-L-alanine--D-glutamate ligase [Borrelia miyamotoi]WAZ85016.1 UDP-N-acetylmuramoyl-L-alanine--D-glutamate ligase [Borrelia miyamotoi]WAZ90799.1 UDP-N-acetylmuramoyl-L-alanine--D-glutamate ligase [Borrelia miyamotoi]